MALNPTYQGTDVQLSGDNPVNDPQPRKNTTSNKFNTSYPHVTTARYGTVTPFYVANTVEKEQHPLFSSHEVRAQNSMVSPTFGDIVMKKSYFDVPLRAIYPLNYDLMRVPPVAGDDIDNLTISNKACIHKGFFFSLQNYLKSLDLLAGISVTDYVRYLFLLEKFFSRASLFDYLGCHLSSIFNVAYHSPLALGSKFSSFDLWFEAIVDHYFNDPSGWCIVITDSTGRKFAPYSADTPDNTLGLTYVSMHYILEKLRDNCLEYDIDFYNTSDPLSTISDDPEFGYIYDGIRISWDNSTDLNIERLVAYQLACVEYFTDDHIDNIYSTDQFRQMMRYYSNSIISTDVFELNGVKFQYDVFACYYWFHISSHMASFDTDLFNESLPYMFALLTKRHSLRFEDYFVGGRLSPLAVGDVNTPVIDGQVNAYEVARSMVFTRFLNSVNLSGPEFDNYSKDILDNNAPPRNDVPKFLAMSMSNVSSYEVENTADNQGALVTNLRSSDERFAFDITLDHDSIVLGLCSFECRRMYSKTVDRFFFHNDRYDSFNPKLQHTGDQSISLAELRAGANFDDNFAYGVADGEYKQRVGVVSGGIVDFLPTWTMVTDTVDSYDDDANLNSSYIRSKDVEFDRFFGSMSNNSDAGYFHFVISFNNHCEPIKPMIVAPEILL